MKMKSLLTMLLALWVVGAVASDVSPKEKKTKGWQPLFTENLSNAVYDGDVWSLNDGVLSAVQDKEIWTRKEYENFIVDLEFKTDVATNSGVIVYCTDIRNWIPHSVEIQIADDHSEKWGNERKDFQCGAIFGHLAASEQKVVKKPGEWNRMVITCKGQVIEVVLNGKKVTRMDMSQWTSGKKNPDGSDIPGWLPTPFAELPTKGFIGLQGKHGDALIWFRNVRIKEL